MGATGATGPGGGATGATGPAGATGATGAPGDDVEATRIIESFHCSGLLENTLLAFDYDAILMSSNDLFATGKIRSLSVSATDAAYYAPSQNGWLTARVIVNIDVDGTNDAGFFTIDLDRSSLVTVIQYRESGGGPVAEAWTMQPSDCVHNFY